MAPNQVDLCGIVLYSLFFMLVCVRVRPFFGEGGLSPTDRIKLGFHFALLGSSLLELGVECCIQYCVHRQQVIPLVVYCSADLIS